MARGMPCMPFSPPVNGACSRMKKTNWENASVIIAN